MKQYPSIDGKIVNHPIIAFDKLDGNNIRCEFNKKHGLHKFGSRKALLSDDYPLLKRSEGMILEKYGEDLPRIFSKEQLPEVTCYFEFHGEKSFAGRHDPEDPTLTVTLLDIDIYKKGLVTAQRFLKLFEGKVDIPRVVYVGNPTQDFIESVKNGTLPFVTFEGVVCRGAPLKKGYQPHAFKVKSLAWIQKVREVYGNDPKVLADLL